MITEMTKVTLPVTGVELYIPEGVSLYIICGKDKTKLIDGVNHEGTEFEAIDYTESEAETDRLLAKFQYPIVGFAENLKEIEPAGRKKIALKAILEIAEAAGFDLGDVKKDARFKAFFRKGEGDE